jgi:hypothetical protein
MTKDDKKSRISKSSIPRTHSAGAARRGDRDYAAGRALRRMEALNVRKMETDENSSGALVAGENGGGSHRLQSSGSVRGPLMQISISKSDCTENCNRSNWRRRKIRRIPVQRRRYRSWASPGPAKRRRYLAAAVKLGDALSAVGRTPCLLVWLWRRTLEEAPSGQSTGAQGGTRVCLLGEYEFNRPWPEPESLSASREGHWGSNLQFMQFIHFFY